MENKYKVTLTTMATVTVLVTAETEEDAVRQIKDQDPNSFNWKIETPYDLYEVNYMD